MTNQRKHSEVSSDAADKPYTGFICPIRSRAKEIKCVQKHCQLWVPYPIEGPEGGEITFECAFWVLAHFLTGTVAHLRGLNFSVHNYLKNLAVGAPVPPAPKELSKADTMQYIQDRYPEILVAATPDGVNLQGFIKDEETRNKYFSWIKAQGFKFYPDGPVKFWFKQFPT